MVISMEKLSHLDENGAAVMVDVTDKRVTSREAVASGRILMSEKAFNAVINGNVPKGDVLSAARIAGIMAAKRTSDIIPLCHPLPFTKCSVEFTADKSTCSISAKCTAKVEGKTGIEMEALTGVSAALLTIYDMCKAADRSMVITDVRLEYKSGGKSGVFRRDADV